MHIRPLATLTALAVSLSAALSQESDDMQKSYKFERTITRTLSLQYLLFTPKGYDPKGAKQWPLILFLHGAGERGTNLQQVTVHGPPKIVKSRPDFPFLVASPQCPNDEIWSNEAVLALLDEVIAKQRVDTNRVYLTGLSMGGFGSWSLALSNPERFAAVAPICGGGNPLDALLASRKKAAALKGLPFWAFHGAKDPVVKLEESQRMVAALKKAGVKEVELTVYPEAEHDSWTETYNNEKLYEWFLKHERR
jgi:predicted peptidase